MVELTPDEKLTAILSYLSILVLIPQIMTSGKRTPFITFHLKEGWALIVAWLVLYFGYMILLLIPGLNIVFGILGIFYYLVLFILFLAIIIIAMSRALKGEMWEIPVVHKIAGKIPIQ